MGTDFFGISQNSGACYNSKANFKGSCEITEKNCLKAKKMFELDSGHKFFPILWWVFTSYTSVTFFHIVQSPLVLGQRPLQVFCTWIFLSSVQECGNGTGICCFQPPCSFSPLIRIIIKYGNVNSAWSR